VCVRKVGAQIERPEIRLGRVLELSRFAQGDSQAVVGVGEAGALAHGPAEVFNGFLAPAELMARQAQVIERIHMLWISGQDLPIQVLGSMNLPRSLIRDGCVEDLGNRSHLSRTFLLT
jgi:hypothetical protein